MKKPGKMSPAKGSKERSQGKVKGSGVNTPMKQANIPQKRPGTTYGAPTQKQGL